MRPEPTDKESVVTIVSLRTGGRSQVQILDERESPLAFRGRLSCRGGTALCRKGDRIYRFSLESLLLA